MNKNESWYRIAAWCEAASCAVKRRHVVCSSVMWCEAASCGVKQRHVVWSRYSSPYEYVCFTCMRVFHMNACVSHACVCFTWMRVFHMNACVSHERVCFTWMRVFDMNACVWHAWTHTLFGTTWSRCWVPWMHTYTIRHRIWGGYNY